MILIPEFNEHDPGFKPLGEVSPTIIKHSAGRLALLPVLGEFGTAGDPELTEDWRRATTDYFIEATEVHGISKAAQIFNPIKPEWQPEDAVIESWHLARDTVVAIPVLDFTPGQASLAETGFAALGGIRRGQDVYYYIEPGLNYNDAIKRARTLTTMIMKKTIEDFPVNAYQALNLEDLTSRSVNSLVRRVKEENGKVIVERRLKIEHKQALNPTIALVGSGANHFRDSWYADVAKRLHDFLDVPKGSVYTAYVKNWDMDDAHQELYHKTSDAVVLFAVTEDQLSYGAMGELGWLSTYCSSNGQKLGVYVEAHNSEPKSDPNRQRKLGIAHLTRLLQDFPDLSIFVARSLKELSVYGASELYKYMQQQKAAESSH